MDDIVSYYNTLKYIHDQLKQNYVLSQTYKLEFEKLKTFSDEIRLSREDGWRQCNRSKNRYKDILPYDKHRVRLPEINNIMGSDYINASYIAGPAGFCGYIASQGPLPNTVFDFWRMVWYEHVTAIVMVCREVEMGRVKCANYWGQQVGELQKWGNFQVQLIEEDKRTTFVIRKLVITCAGVTREVHQYQYLQWPDRDVPTDPIPLHEMLHIVREQCPEKSTENNNPVVVHCSAGCGRTGTVMSIDFVHVCIKQQLLDKQFSVFEMVRNMREHRLAICQTKQQYGFVYESALQLLDGALSTLNIRLEAVSASIYENVPSSPSYNTAISHDDVEPIVDGVPPIPPPKSGQHPTKPKTKPTNYQAKLVAESTPPTTPHTTPPTTQPEPTVDHREPVYASVNPFTRTGQLIDIDDEPRKQTIPPYSSGPGSTTPSIPPKPSITSLSSAAPLKTAENNAYEELQFSRSVIPSKPFANQFDLLDLSFDEQDVVQSPAIVVSSSAPSNGDINTYDSCATDNSAYEHITLGEEESNLEMPPPIPTKKRCSVINNEYTDVIIPASPLLSHPTSAPFFLDRPSSPTLPCLSPDELGPRKRVSVVEAYTDVEIAPPPDKTQPGTVLSVNKMQPGTGTPCDKMQPGRTPPLPPPYKPNDLISLPANRNSIRYDDDNYSELSMPRSDATGDSPSAQNTSEEEEEDIYETIDTVPSTTAKKDDTLTRTAKLTVAGKKFKGFKGFIASTKDSVLSSMSDTAHSASHNLKQSASQNLKKTRSFTPGTSPVPAVRNSAKHIAATDIPEFEFGKRTARPKGPRDMPSHWLTT